MSEAEDDYADERDAWDSGPFCRHWGDPSSCDHKCLACGDGCGEHGASDGDHECFVCSCLAWTEES